MKSYFGTLFMNDISERIKYILSNNIPIYLDNKPFLESISSWFDKILDKAALYKSSKQEDKYQKLLTTIKEVSSKLTEVINDDEILRSYNTSVHFNIFEVKNNDKDPLVLKLYFNIVTKACYYPSAQGMNLFTYINEVSIQN
jgi:hypothetical protein